MAGKPDFDAMRVKNVSRETHQRLTVFHDLLQQWQASINLIAPSTVHEIWERHIEDSLQTCALAKGVKSIIDLGSGGGLPGIILAIAMVEQGGGRIDLIESSGKKCSFLRAAARKLNLKNLGVGLHIHCERIENVIDDLPTPQIVTARALASLDTLLDLAAVQLEQGAVGMFAKGKNVDAELEAARANWQFDVESFDSALEAGSVILRISNLKRMTSP